MGKKKIRSKVVTRSEENEPAEVSSNTKLHRLEAMLRQPEGATIAQLSKALGWKPHSVRGAMSGALKKKLGLEIATSKTKGADRIYRISN